MPLVMRGPPGESGKDGRDGKDGTPGGQLAIRNNSLHHLSLLHRFNVAVKNGFLKNAIY
jgi:hypothetical protein